MSGFSSVARFFHWDDVSVTTIGRTWRAKSSMFKVYVMAASVACLLPFLYDIIIGSAVSSVDYDRRHTLHIAMNVVFNMACIAVVFVARGDFQSRLRRGLVGVTINFGLLLFVILAMRLYYSRPLLIASFFASIALVALFSMAIDGCRKRRIGVVPMGVDKDVVQHVGGGAVFVASPDEAAWTYDVVLLDWARVQDDRWLRFASRAILSGVEVNHVAAYIEHSQGRVPPEHFEVDHAAPPRGSVYINIYKRLFDISFVVMTAPLALLIVAIAAIAIRVKMGSPVFFTQPRLGVDGRPFEIYKLRTMRAPRAGEGATATSIGDDRITPLGTFLRRFRIDEIPQFYNVLIGDMSLIGPRPEQPGLALTYTNSMPSFANRTLLRPGITGWAQVRCGYAANEAETKSKLSYDLYYLKHAGLVMDMYILLQTFRTLATGHSAR